MKYVSTRGRAPTLEFADVLLEGLARDGGLYVPERIPRLPADPPVARYQHLATEVIAPYADDVPDLVDHVEAAYGFFEHEDVIPLAFAPRANVSPEQVPSQSRP